MLKKLLVVMLMFVFSFSMIFAQDDPAVKVDANGNVGIGTTTMTGRLNIPDNGSIGGAFDFTKSSLFLYDPLSTNVLGVDSNQISTSNDLFISSSSGRIMFQTQNPTLTRMVINNNGYVGIGATSPAYPLHVVGKGYFTSEVRLGPIGTEGGQLYFEPSSGNTGFYIDSLVNDARLVTNNPATTTFQVFNVGTPTMNLSVDGKGIFGTGLDVSNMVTIGAGNTTEGTGGRITLDGTDGYSHIIFDTNTNNARLLSYYTGNTTFWVSNQNGDMNLNVDGKGTFQNGLNVTGGNVRISDKLGIGIDDSALIKGLLNVNGTIAIGSNDTGGKLNGTGRALEIMTDTTFGGSKDLHTGIRMFSTMGDVFQSAVLGVQVSDSWGTYFGGDTPVKSDMAMVLGLNEVLFRGKMGIGTSSPHDHAKLDVNGKMFIKDDLIMNPNGSIGFNAYWGNDRWNYRTTGYAGYLKFNSDGTLVYQNTNISGTIADGPLTWNNPIAFSIDKNSNVGIGTSTPSYQFHVNGRAMVEDELRLGPYGGEGGQLYFEPSSGSYTGFYMDSVGNNPRLITNNTGRPTFTIDNANSGTSKMDLSVDGEIRAGDGLDVTGGLEVSGNVDILGSVTTCSWNQEYIAGTDGFVVAWDRENNLDREAKIIVYAVNQTTSIVNGQDSHIRMWSSVGDDTGIGTGLKYEPAVSVNCPVKAGEKFKVYRGNHGGDNRGRVMFIPFGSGGLTTP